MNGDKSTTRSAQRVFPALLAAVVTVGTLLVGVNSASAAVTLVKGSAYGHLAAVSLFGGPVGWRGPEGHPGCLPGVEIACSAAVSLPPNGAPRSKTDPGANGATATYGPANIFSSGQQQVSTQAVLGVNGSVTSTASLAGVNVTGDEVFDATSVSSTCTASEAGVSASTTVNNGRVRISEGNPDVDGDETYGAVPVNPPQGFTIHGTLESVGDQYDYKFNEQVVHPDGSITVYAAHLYLLGPNAVGHVWIGKSTCGVQRREAPNDFNIDGRTDVSIYRPSNGYWFVNGGAITQFGAAGDIPVPGDYDNDGDTDVAVFRPSNGYWFIHNGPIVQYGGAGDIPVPADYDGDGDTDIAVFRPSNGYWYINNIMTPNIVQYGANGDIPVPADYDGDGDADIAIYRPSNGYWFINGGAITQFGAPGDIPVPGDYDGDGDYDVAVFRQSNGYWFVSGGAITQYGANGDIPVPGNYDGDADTDIAVFRPSNGYWFVNGGAITQFGANGDVPLPIPDAIRRFFFTPL
ncbi:MAG: VCBS repeat-containing protein [Actinomycetota bacterium]|nr:VCBS repeat-containing protein [Actinomycetota bacterium]